MRARRPSSRVLQSYYGTVSSNSEFLKLFVTFISLWAFETCRAFVDFSGLLFPVDVSGDFPCVFDLQDISG